MANLVSSFGAFAGGLAQGIEAGQGLAYRKQLMELQERQAEIQQAQGIINIMQIQDPVVQEFALSTILPKMGISADSPQFKNMIKLTKAKGESKQAVVEWFASQVGEGVPVKELMQGFADDSLAVLQNVAEFQKSKRAEAREERRLGFEEQRMGFEEKRLGLEERGLGLEARRTAAAEAQEARLAEQAEQQAGIEAMNAMISAAKIEDPKTRAAVMGRLNEQLKLGYSADELEQFAAGEQDLDVLEQGLEIEKLGLQIDDLRKKAKASGLSTTELKGYALMRSKGADHENMPSFIKDMSEEQAAEYVDLLTRPPVDVDIGQGQLKTKAAFDRATLNLNDLRLTQNMIAQVIEKARKDPEAFSSAGRATRFMQKAIGTVKSLGGLLASFKKQLGRDVNFMGKELGPEAKSDIGRVLSDPEVPYVEFMEVALATRLARLSGTTRVLKDEWEAARSQAKLTGWFEGDVNYVIKRLEAINTGLLEPMAQSLEEIINRGEVGVFEGGMQQGEVEETPTGDSELDEFLEDMGILE